MASPSEPTYAYDVFVSFRGPDVRTNFLSHLHEALEKNLIRAYIDSKDLWKGERISDAIIKAIKESRFAIVLFSKDYATSTWCLDEVVNIMGRHQTNSLSVLPVFYKVEPREVRNPRYSYKKAFDEHEKKYKEDAEIVKKWKKALLDAGNLSGWEFDDEVTEAAKGKSAKLGNREFKNEAELKISIVEEIWKQLQRQPLNVAMHPVGIDSQLDELKLELNMESEDEVQDRSLIIGLWAMGGMGKTTLAKALYNSIFRKFEASAFLESIGDSSKDSNYMVCCQKQLLYQVLRRKEIVNNVSGGSSLIRSRLEWRRVLLILDGVETPNQISDLAGCGNWFGNGSRIIITTRNNGLLKAIGAHIYEVRALTDHDAVELFKKCVSEDTSKYIRSHQVEKILKYTQGLPLALEKLGYEFGANGDLESVLETFAAKCHLEIRVKLEKSYNELDKPDKDIFLHIACFFNGWIRNNVEGVLGSRYRDAARVVDDLIKRSLIRDNNGTLQVHVLVELMAKLIVDRACHDDPATRSRIWSWNELADALSRKKEENASVKAIVVDLKKPQEIDIGPAGFENLNRLEFLILINVDTNFKGSIRLPKELRWFEWHGRRPSGIKFTDTPRKLAVLSVRQKEFSRTGETVI